MCGETSDFISQTFGRDLSNFRKDLFVDVKIIGKFQVMFLKQDFCGSFDCFCSNSAHTIL
jgi:hypothetical protein